MSSSGDKAIQVSAWGLTGLVVILSAWGWLNDAVTLMTLFFAGMFGVLQLLVNKSGEWARRLWSGRLEHKLTVPAVLAMMIACGLLVHYSLKMAWADAVALGLVTPDPMTEALLMLLPFLEPFVFWTKHCLSTLPERRDSGDATSVSLPVTPRANGDSGDVALVSPECPGDRGNVTPLTRRDTHVTSPGAPSGRALGALGAAAVTALAASAADAGASTAERDTRLVSPAERWGTRVAGDNERVARACHLRDSGMSRDEVAKKMAVSPRTVSRYWAQARRAA